LYATFFCSQVIHSFCLYLLKPLTPSAFKESALLNRLLFGKIPNAEAVAVPLNDYLDSFPVAPIVWEIKKNGLALF
jgi:hypothetical protein